MISSPNISLIFWIITLQQCRKEFDEIAEGEVKWTSILKTFYDQFHPSVENTLAIKTEHKVGERILGEEPETGKPVSVKIGRFGPMAQIGTAEDEEKPRFAQMKKVSP